MSLLHSFYCWGHVAVVLLSTAYFALAGVDNWRYLPFLWAVPPLLNAFLYAKVPMRRRWPRTSARRFGPCSPASSSGCSC